MVRLAYGKRGSKPRTLTNPNVRHNTCLAKLATPASAWVQPTPEARQGRSQTLGWRTRPTVASNDVHSVRLPNDAAKNTVASTIVDGTSCVLPRTASPMNAIRAGGAAAPCDRLRAWAAGAVKQR